jgi:hypothetical protein
MRIMGDKKLPGGKWKPFQTRRATAHQLETWFGHGSDFAGVLVIFGAASGHLGSRDFDTMGSYNAWARAHPELAAMLPTVATKRGRHVYFVTDPADVARVRTRLGKPDGMGAIHCPDGELRVGVGCYSVLPPSRHPSGSLYRWLIAPGAVIPPAPDLEAAGFCPPILRRAYHATQRAQNGSGELVCEYGIKKKETCKTRDPETNGKPPSNSPHCLGFSVSSVSRATAERIELAIARTAPTRRKQRHDLVFKLARELKAIPELCDKPATALRPIVLRWHKAAARYLTKGFTETWSDFAEGWDKVKHPAGTGPLRDALAAADATPLPEAADKYPEPSVKRLVALCAELQRRAGEATFYLAVRTVGELFAVHHGTAARWLRALRIDGVLRLAKAHGPMQAAEYLFMSSDDGPLDERTDSV